MTAKITIVVETDRKDATWADVLEAISCAGSPGQKSRPVHKNDYTTEWGNSFGRYFNAPRIEGIKVVTTLEVTPELPNAADAQTHHIDHKKIERAILGGELVYLGVGTDDQVVPR